MNVVSTIRVCIVDDELMARRTIAKLLSADAGIEVVGEAANGTAAVRLLRDQRPDLVFLDIKMPGLDGFGVLEQLGDEAPRHVVFVTAYDAYAVKAFSVEAVDYLLKPFDDETFHRVLERAKRRIARAQLVDTSERLAVLARYLYRDAETRTDKDESIAEDAGADRIAIKVQGETRLIETDSIDWIAAVEHYAEIHAGSETFLVRETISHLEQRLSPHRFFRIHRSAIVNLARVRTLTPARHGDYTCELKGGTSLRVSRSRAEALKRLLSA